MKSDAAARPSAATTPCCTTPRKKNSSSTGRSSTPNSTHSSVSSGPSAAPAISRPSRPRRAAPPPGCRARSRAARRAAAARAPAAAAARSRRGRCAGRRAAAWRGPRACPRRRSRAACRARGRACRRRPAWRALVISTSTLHAKAVSTSRRERPRAPVRAPRSRARRRERAARVAPATSRATCSGVPAATISPPAAPPSGPRSITQSALRITSRWCSITTTLLPSSTSWWSTPSRFATSAKWRPVVGSSSRYERAPGRALRQLAPELDALRLAARERGGRLAELEIAEAHRRERLERPAQRRHVLEQRERFLDAGGEHLGDALALVPHLERLAVVAPAPAHLAGDVQVGQEVHLDLELAVALARLAAPALHVEREAPGP